MTEARLAFCNWNVFCWTCIVDSVSPSFLMDWQKVDRCKLPAVKNRCAQSLPAISCCRPIRASQANRGAWADSFSESSSADEQSDDLSCRSRYSLNLEQSWSETRRVDHAAPFDTMRLLIGQFRERWVHQACWHVMSLRGTTHVQLLQNCSLEVRDYD